MTLVNMIETYKTNIDNDFADGKMRKYSKMKSEHGFTKFLAHNAFNQASNGFLVDNGCTFGVEVSVLKASNKGESLTIFKEPQLGSFFWSISSFSNKTNEFYLSEPFTVKGRKWYVTFKKITKSLSNETYERLIFRLTHCFRRLMIYPNGLSSGKTSHISLYLKLDSSETVPTGKKIYAKFFLSVYNFGAKKYVDQSSKLFFFEFYYENKVFCVGILSEALHYLQMSVGLITQPMVMAFMSSCLETTFNLIICKMMFSISKLELLLCRLSKIFRSK